MRKTLGGDFIPEGAVILRGNGWCVTLCCVGQKYNSFSNGNPLTFPLMPHPSFPFSYRITTSNSSKTAQSGKFNEMQKLNSDMQIVNYSHRLCEQLFP